MAGDRVARRVAGARAEARVARAVLPPCGFRRAEAVAVGQDGRGGEPELLHGELVDERLQGGAGLAQREDTVVVAEPGGVLDVVRADVREDLGQRRPLKEAESGGGVELDVR